MISPQNIYIVGAQCTGKTTLVNALDNYFGRMKVCNPSGNCTAPKIIKEVARSAMKKYELTANDLRDSKTRALELQYLILEAQWKAESAVGHDWYISDRSAIDPIMYTTKFVNLDAAFNMKKTAISAQLCNKMKRSIVIVCEPRMDWLKDDETRLMPANKEEWISLHKICCELLSNTGIKYYVLLNSIPDLDSRVNFVLGKWSLGSTESKSDTQRTS